MKNDVDLVTKLSSAIVALEKDLNCHDLPASFIHTNVVELNLAALGRCRNEEARVFLIKQLVDNLELRFGWAGLLVSC